VDVLRELEPAEERAPPRLHLVVVEPHPVHERAQADARHVGVANTARADDVKELLAHRQLGVRRARDERARLRGEHRAPHEIGEHLVRSVPAVPRRHALQLIETRQRDDRADLFAHARERLSDGGGVSVGDDDEPFARPEVDGAVDENPCGEGDFITRAVVHRRR
jgi:hypothetical protein